MVTVTLRLTKDLQRFVEGQVESGEFGGAAEYIQTLIEQAQRGQQKLESLLIEGLDSGAPIPLDASEWARIRRDVELRVSNGQ